ncbi:MAG TPA: hypothetical protein VFS21_16720 [Roseiflexaceae bacterium]|nr:hypothetical protein [Roseiflexaceae bacterium]
MFLSGSKAATLHQIRLVDIHGTRFYDLAFAHTDTPDQLRTARVGVDDVYPSPQPGETILVRYVMNVAVGVERGAAE